MFVLALTELKKCRKTVEARYVVMNWQQSFQRLSIRQRKEDMGFWFLPLQPQSSPLREQPLLVSIQFVLLLFLDFWRNNTLLFPTFVRPISSKLFVIFMPEYPRSSSYTLMPVMLRSKIDTMCFEAEQFVVNLGQQPSEA